MRRAVVVLSATAGLATAGAAVAVGALAATSPAATPHCTINFSASTQNPTVGQNITLRWRTTGADLLVASWTTAPLPFTGTQVTTKNAAGPASYQVTGLKSGQYCGGGVVNVVFRVAGAPSSAASTPAPSTPSSPSTPIATASSSTASIATSVHPSTSASYPAQSPTGGSGVPWWQQPADLAAIGVLSLLGAAAMMRRERLRAVLTRRH